MDIHYILYHTLIGIVNNGKANGSTPKIVMILGSIIYSTILLTTSLDERGSPAARAAYHTQAHCQ